MSNAVNVDRNGSQAQCPRCRSWCSTGNLGMRSACKCCSTQLQRVYQFCWACKREWPNKQAALEETCSLPQCGLRAALLSPETITGHRTGWMVGCPLFRACPVCHALVSHSGTGCCNLDCPDCRTRFCFRCLKQGVCRGNCKIVDNSSSLRDMAL